MTSMKKKIPFLILFPIIFLAMNGFMAKDDFESETISIGVVVTDLDRSMDFYQNVIGMTRTGGFEVDADFGKRSGLTDSKSFSVEVLKLKDSSQATEWKLMSFGTGAGHSNPSYIHNDTGIQYVTIFVKSLEPFLSRIEKHKVKLLGETPVQLDEERHFVLVQDPDGTFIELIGPLE